MNEGADEEELISGDDPAAMLSLSAKENVNFITYNVDCITSNNSILPVAAPLDRLHTYSVEEQEVEEKVEK